MNLLRGILYTIYTLLIYLGLPLLGWVLGGLPAIGGLDAFFASPPRLALAVGIALFSAAIGWQASVNPQAVNGSRGEERKLVSRQHILAQVLVPLLFVVMLFLPLADRLSFGVLADLPALRWVGVLPALAGYALVFLSSHALGRMYSPEVTIQKDHHLVTGGVYARVRHPRYLGVLLLALGTALIFRSWIGLLMAAAVLGLLLFRIRDEEVLMSAEFGGEWQAYCRRSWRLIPGVW